MLLRFKFSNYGSFRVEQELSLVAGSLNDRRESVFQAPGLKDGVLPMAAIYGANASGKTTVLRALEFMGNAVRDSHRLWEPGQQIPVEPFAGEADGLPTTFMVDSVFAGIRHQYGFAINSDGVLQEWLHVYPKGKKQTWFSRKGGPISFGEKLIGDNRVIEQLTRKNSLFLSAAAQNNHEMLLPVYNWFRNSLKLFVGGRGLDTAQTINMCEDPDALGIITRLLRVADLGIADLRVTVSRLGEGREQVAKLSEETRPNSGHLVRFLEEPIISLSLRHRINGRLMSFGLEYESAGTLAYLALLGPIVYALQQGGVICVDELDSSLHPLIAIEIMRLFESRSQNPRGAQLIFNTHDTNLLNTGMLRRDQIWFTEKDVKGESHLYPLTDFKPRRQENLESGYLQGRYGAIPFLNSHEFVTSLAQGDGETK